MGTWDVGSFDNDAACDWAGQLQAYPDLSFVDETLSTVIEEGEYLEASGAEEAIAAAEVVARLQGNWGDRNAYSERADRWIEQAGITPNRTIAIKAHQAIDRILSEPSELLELWQESDEFELWRKTLLGLKARVQI